MLVFQALTLSQGMTMTNIHFDTQNFTFETLHGGQLTLSTQLIILKPGYTLPPMQNHSFFKNLPPMVFN